ncbi:MAG: hypothetical protein M9888_00275 [Chitinophagales bacterium]|nr:hypothetical protein [Chitinophagales bacterium]
MAKSKPTSNLKTPQIDKNNAHKVSDKILIPAFILFFIVLAYSYASPLLEGMMLSTHDMNEFLAMSKEVSSYKEATGHISFWSSRMFSGMPAYAIGGIEFATFLNYTPLPFIHKIFNLMPFPAVDIVLMLIGAFIGFYILTKKSFLSFLGAIAIGFCSANFVILDAGHITKINTIAMFIPLFASVWLVFRGKYFIGGIAALVFFFEIVYQRHIQIAYYSFILIGIYGVYEIVINAIEKKFKHIAISSLILAVALAVSMLMNFDNFFVKQFSKETTRGGDILHAELMGKQASELPSKEQGVGFEYATSWSYGFNEIGSWLVPNFTGGSSSGSLDENSEVYKVLTSRGVQSNQAQQFVQHLPLYWGDQPFVQGEMYFGAIVILLFIFGLFSYTGFLKKWIIGAIVLSTLIAMGKNVSVFYKILYDYVPLFNMYRSPTMILSLTQALVVLLGILGLNEFLEKNKDGRLKVVKQSAITIGGVFVLVFLLSSTMSFKPNSSEASPSGDVRFESQLEQMTGDKEFASSIYSALVSDRVSLLRSDAVRSFIFIAIVIALLYILAIGKLKNENIVIGVIAILILTDFWSVSKRSLNNDDFVDKDRFESLIFPLTPADRFILSDNKDGARMVDLTKDVFNTATPAYYHRTIGGYTPAKLKRYQDVIEYGITYDFQLLNKTGFEQTNFLNMLNTKYLKRTTEEKDVVQNPNALGNAWMVNHIQWVESPEKEILNVRDINPKNTVIIHKEFEPYLTGFTPNSDSVMHEGSRYITKVDTKDPMKLEYHFKSDKPEMIVFSEVIYRPNIDWIAYVDGKKSEHIRVNYILRGMKVDAGEHIITFEFKPVMAAVTDKVMIAGYAIFYILIALLGGLYYRKNKHLSVEV